jgi:hypothetical protein
LIWIPLLLSLAVVCLAGIAVYQLPYVQQHLTWRVESLVAGLRRVLNPPEEIVFVPVATGLPPLMATPVEASTTLPPPSVTSYVSDLLAATPTESATTSVASPSPKPTETPLPTRTLLTGVVHEYQQFNNCGPTNLAMALSYWGWLGDQRDTRRFLRPNLKVDDKNVMPSEMVEFVERYAGLRAIVRVGGDLDLLRSLIAAGFPVLIETGHHPPKDWWMGHYLVVNGYDDSSRMFMVQDSLANPDKQMTYDEIVLHWWRDFNYVYLVIFPLERESQVSSILGSRWNEQASFQLAARKAQDEIPTLTGRDLFFAWFNLGSSYVGTGDYAKAAVAFDKAFELYSKLSEEQRPYRLMWYQTGPYQAYYNIGRYQDVINLANTTFTWVGQPVLEESYYWRGMAYLALGKQNNAIYDFQKAVALNPNYSPPRDALLHLGVQLP